MLTPDSRAVPLAVGDVILVQYVFRYLQHWCCAVGDVGAADGLELWAG